MAIKSPDHWLEISSKKNEITEFNLVKGSERGVLKSLRSPKKKKKKKKKRKKDKNISDESQDKVKKTADRNKISLD